MRRSGHTWALVLAAGEGSRLRSLTADRLGFPVPKQYCSLRGGPTLLQETLRRAAKLCTPDRISLIVADQHREWWETPQRKVLPRNIVVQPENRGTGIGILLQLLHVLRLEPDADVVLLPSDHYVGNEPVLERATRAALDHVRNTPNDIVLLGMEPSFPDPELGYIVPAVDGVIGPQTVARFVEKPSVAQARTLIRDGALWNAFIVAARGSKLLELFDQRAPEVVKALRSCRPLAAVYEHLPVIDFSRHILATAQLPELRVHKVPECGWNDLGTPERVGVTLARLPLPTDDNAGPDIEKAAINLAINYQRAATAKWPVARAGINN